MRLKKILALSALAAFLVCACSDDDDNQNTPTPDRSVAKDLGSDANDGGGIDATGDAASTAPYITEMIPSDGFANGGKSGTGTPVLLTGGNFKQGVTIYIDGSPQSLVVSVASSVSMTFTIPKNEYGNTVRKADIMIGLNNEFSNQYSTDDPAWAQLTHTVEAPADTAFIRGFVRMYDVSADWDNDATVNIDDWNFMIN